MPEIHLGEIISRLHFAHSEKMRILTLLKDENAEHFKIVRTALKTPGITEAKFCAWAAKKMNSKGDRVGGEVQREKILSRVIGYAKGNGQISEQCFWMIYRTCISRTVTVKMPELQKLLLEIKVDPTNASTASIFTKILNSRSAFKVPLTNIRELYLLWGFTRDQSIEVNFQPQTSTVDEAQIATLEASIIELKTKIQKESEAREISIERERENTESEIEKIEEKIDEASEQTDAAIEDTKKQIAHTQKAIDNIRAELKAYPDKKYVKSVKEEVEKLDAQIKHLHLAISNLEKNQILQNKELGRVNEKIGRKFLAATATTKNLRKVDSGKNQMPEIEFVHHWKKRLEQTTFYDLDIDDLLAIHLFFKYFKCFVLKDNELFETWLATLGWQQLIQSCVAEPAWYKSDQCETLQAFVATEDAPNILRITNFNSALPEGYLLPLVLPWLQREEFVDRKLVLIAAPGTPEGLREAAQYFPILASNSGKLDPSPISSNVRAGSLAASGNPFFISTLSIWPIEMKPLFQDNRELLSLLEAQNIELPPSVLRTYTQFRAILEGYYDQNSSILASFQLIIQPWIQHCHNEIYAEQVIQNLRLVYG